MFKLVIIGTIVALAAASSHPINKQIIADIRQRTHRWEAYDFETNPMKDYSYGKLMGLLGTVNNPAKERIPEFSYADVEMLQQLPANFDWRTESQCVHPVRDQQHCGSCWAFAASEALSDRFCIASKGAVDVVLSPQDMVSCDNWDMGCNGGILSFAWSYLTSTGIVTDTCTPYVSGDGSVPKCPKTCEDGSDRKKYKCASGSVVKASGAASIQSEIFANGPLETGFDVYEDFFSYKSGIYHYTSGAKAGGHAVKIIGWGQENGVNYWICANSWGNSWGMEGFFNIEWGQCGIDSAAYGCKPQL
jgi:cathepsin B